MCVRMLCVRMCARCVCVYDVCVCVCVYDVCDVCVCVMCACLGLPGTVRRKQCGRSLGVFVGPTVPLSSGIGSLVCPTAAGCEATARSRDGGLERVGGYRAAAGSSLWLYSKFPPAMRTMMMMTR